MGKIKQLIEDHPNIWEFIKFNVLSNCATITNFIIMWLCTGFIFKSFANTPFKFLVFNYADNIGDFLRTGGDITHSLHHVIYHFAAALRRFRST